MRSITTLLALLSFVAHVRCIDFYITSPYDAISWNLGEKASITWNILPGGADVGSVKVDLMDGDDNSANVICNIASGLPPSSTSTSWIVPKSLSPRMSYFVRVSGVTGTSPLVVRYSHRFSIKGQPCSKSETITQTSTSSKTQATTKAGGSSSSTSNESTTVTSNDFIDFNSSIAIPRSHDPNYAAPLTSGVYGRIYITLTLIVVILLFIWN